MKSVKILLILTIILLIIYTILSNCKVFNYINVKEGFSAEVWSGINKNYGNCIYNNETNISYNNPSVVIKLPDESKITGFYIKLNKINTTGTGTNKIPIHSTAIENNLRYSVSVGNDLTNMIDVINEYGFNKFKFDVDVKNISLFENEDGTSKYNGRNVKISLQNLLNNEILNIDKAITYNLEVKIFGLDIYALNSKTYSNYTPVTKNIDANYVINLNSNKKIVAINMNAVTTTDIVKIVYDNNYDNNKRKYIAIGPIRQGFDISSNKSNIIYFNKPIIASNIYFKKLDNSNENLGTGSDNDIIIYESEVSKRDEINFKFDKQIENNDKLGIAIQGEKCPSVNQLMRRQTQAQQICEALEYKDRIRNYKIVYEKEKEYLKKLAHQEKELKELETLINSLISRKNNRIKNNKNNSVEALDRELRKIEEIRKQAEKELLDGKKVHDLKVELNLEPKFNDILAKYNIE